MKYRGRGIFQLAFKDNYEGFDKGCASLWNDAKSDFLLNPEKVMEFPYSLRFATWFWVSKKIYFKADEGVTGAAVAAVTRIINPPQHNLAQLTKNFHEFTYPAFK